MGRTAKEVFAANGFADRITLVPGWSSRVELPERANVLVAEIIGNDPLEEGVMDLNIQPHATRDWPQLSSPIVLADLDLSGTKPPLVNESAELIIETPGLLGGLLVYFELDVAPGERISTAPAEAGEMCSWSARVWTSGTQQPASRGDRIKVDYKYRVDSSQTRIEMTLQNSGSSSS